MQAFLAKHVCVGWRDLRAAEKGSSLREVATAALHTSDRLLCLQAGKLGLSQRTPVLLAGVAHMCRMHWLT